MDGWCPTTLGFDETIDWTVYVTKRRDDDDDRSLFPTTRRLKSDV